MNYKICDYLEVCWVCGEHIRVLKNPFHVPARLKEYSTPGSFCDACRKKYPQHAVLLYNPHECHLIKMTEEAFTAFFGHPMPENRIQLADETVMDIAWNFYGGVSLQSLDDEASTATSESDENHEGEDQFPPSLPQSD